MKGYIVQGWVQGMSFNYVYLLSVHKLVSIFGKGFPVFFLKCEVKINFLNNMMIFIVRYERLYCTGVGSGFEF